MSDNKSSQTTEVLDIATALKQVEISLRDFIAYRMKQVFGDEWLAKMKISADRVQIWEATKEEAHKKASTGILEQRILYFSQFFDLVSIVEKNWDVFSETFKDKKTTVVYLEKLNNFRNPEAHRREFLLHEKYLIMGMVGALRTQIAKNRSNQMTPEAFFPFFESAHDSLGNSVPLPSSSFIKGVQCHAPLFPGDLVEYTVTAVDPEDGSLEYRIYARFDESTDWQVSNNLTLEIQEKHITSLLEVKIEVRSNRQYHAHLDHDDKVRFYYKVLPRR